MKEDGARVVQAHRFEVLDEKDRVRAVIGISSHDSREFVGLEIFDRHGSVRAWLLDEPGEGVQLVFATEGNQVLVVSANDGGGELDAGPSITLCDSDGAPILAWAVSAEGNVSMVEGG